MGLIQESRFTKMEIKIRIQIQVQEKTNEKPCLFRQVEIKITKLCHEKYQKNSRFPHTGTKKPFFQQYGFYKTKKPQLRQKIR